MDKDLLNDKEALTLSTSFEELANKAEQTKESFDKLEDMISSDILASFPKPKFELGEKVFFYNKINHFMVRGIICRIVQGLKRADGEETIYYLQGYPLDLREDELYRFPQ